MTRVMNLAEFVLDAIGKKRHVLLNTVCIDKPPVPEYDGQGLLIISEGESRHDAEYEDETGIGHYETTLKITVIYRDRSKAMTICHEMTELAFAALYRAVDRDTSPVCGVSRGNKFVGPGTLNGQPIDGYLARREINVINTIEP